MIGFLIILQKYAIDDKQIIRMEDINKICTTIHIENFDFLPKLEKELKEKLENDNLELYGLIFSTLNDGRYNLEICDELF